MSCVLEVSQTDGVSSGGKPPRGDSGRMEFWDGSDGRIFSGIGWILDRDDALDPITGDDRFDPG